MPGKSLETCREITIMTKNQKEKLAAKIFTFVVVFGMSMVCIPYVVVIIAIYFAVQAVRGFFYFPNRRKVLLRGW